ncbi:MAG: hypothetical protein JWQ23_104 [Herminiimonas sp.]|nr:hypothetical protein [Herminiimonas sp.]
MNFKKLATLLGLCPALLIGAAASVSAEEYPTKPIKLIIPLAPGGSADGVGRMVAKQMSDAWKQPVVVENRSGAAAAIGIAAVAKSPADGYTLLLTPVSIATGKIYVKDPGFDSDKDFSHITQLITTNYLVSVSQDFPAKNLAELVAYAKSNPNPIFHGAGAGGMYLAFEEFAQLADIKATQVNYRGEALAITGLAAGDTQVVFSSLLAAKPFIDSKKIRPLAFASKERVSYAPQIPSSTESGMPSLNIDFWFGLSAPAGTPPEIVKKVADQMAIFMKQPDTVEKLKQLGFLPKTSSPDEFRRHVASERARWTAVAKKAGIEPQ